MSELKLKDILRAQNVKRWVIVNTSRNQSLAEHSFNVIAITRELCNRLNVNDARAMKYAFDHDLDEILTGDIPTPAKKRLGIDTGDGYEGKSLVECSDLEIAVVKVADVLEAILFIEENGVGQHASEVMQYLREKLDKVLGDLTWGWEDMKVAAHGILDEIHNGDYVL